MVATVTLSRPEKRNALDAELVKRLTDVFITLSGDTTCRVVVVTGAGNTFSAGADLAALEAMQTATYDENENDSRALANLFLAIRACAKPVVARINGHAIAGGMGLLLACDAAIAVSDAKFGFPETRIGMVPAIVSVLLREKVGELVLRDMLLKGQLFGADMALKHGLVNSIVPTEDLNQAVAVLAKEYAHNTSSQAVASTKALLSDISSLSFEEAMESAVKANARARSTEDCRAGLSAFLGKTDPPWKVQE
jgi:methylglutaconyl-CoA hydratase